MSAREPLSLAFKSHLDDFMCIKTQNGGGILTLPPSAIEMLVTVPCVGARRINQDKCCKCLMLKVLQQKTDEVPALLSCQVP